VISAREFAQRVADRVKLPLEEVLPFLRERRILPSGGPPRPRKLLITEIAFSGVKSIEGAETPFGFRWHGLGPGLHGIASDGAADPKVCRMPSAPGFEMQRLASKSTAPRIE
jgi:hypothetical protein